ncbi:hypothetical protein, unlikely [Trypanosoma congolense IL3000]|uniref:Uncharacterized protein n=1 Tax=Trypanosoma congolense (strain IL3000) TaxID=1068625 RepID=F9W558_TRYCI|nr:hypothetical protein, unlikely [Trypanosoma congolense IL3000]
MTRRRLLGTSTVVHKSWTLIRECFVAPRRRQSSWYNSSINSACSVVSTQAGMKQAQSVNESHGLKYWLLGFESVGKISLKAAQEHSKHCKTNWLFCYHRCCHKHNSNSSHKRFQNILIDTVMSERFKNK